MGATPRPSFIFAGDMPAHARQFLIESGNLIAFAASERRHNFESISDQVSVTGAAFSPHFQTWVDNSINLALGRERDLGRSNSVGSLSRSPSALPLPDASAAAGAVGSPDGADAGRTRQAEPTQESRSSVIFRPPSLPTAFMPSSSAAAAAAGAFPSLGATGVPQEPVPHGQTQLSSQALDATAILPVPLLNSRAQSLPHNASSAPPARSVAPSHDGIPLSTSVSDGFDPHLRLLGRHSASADDGSSDSLVDMTGVEAGPHAPPGEAAASAAASAAAGGALEAAGARAARGMDLGIGIGISADFSGMLGPELSGVGGLESSSSGVAVSSAAAAAGPAAGVGAGAAGSNRDLSTAPLLASPFSSASLSHATHAPSAGMASAVRGPLVTSRMSGWSSASVSPAAGAQLDRPSSLAMTIMTTASKKLHDRLAAGPEGRQYVP